MTDLITPTEAVHVLGHFGEQHGVQAGGFTRALIDAITKADRPNKVRLAQGFPGYVEAVDVAQNRHDGIAELQSIAAAFGTEGTPE